MRSNPVSSYRGFRYDQRAGVVHVKGPDGRIVTFSQRDGGLRAVKASIDIWCAAGQTLRSNPAGSAPKFVSKMIAEKYGVPIDVVDDVMDRATDYFRTAGRWIKKRSGRS